MATVSTLYLISWYLGPKISGPC